MGIAGPPEEPIHTQVAAALGPLCSLGILSLGACYLQASGSLAAQRVGLRVRCGGFDSQQGHCNWADALSVSCSSGNA